MNALYLSGHRSNLRVSFFVALTLALLLFAVPSASHAEEDSLLQTQTHDRFGLDKPQESLARYGDSGTPSLESQTSKAHAYARGKADERVRSHILQLTTKSLQDGGRSLFGKNFNLHSSLRWAQGESMQGGLTAAIPFAQGSTHAGTFIQPSINLWSDDTEQTRSDFGLGLVKRQRINGLGTTGVSLFLDHSDYGHQRGSLGVDWQGGNTSLAANLHEPLTGARKGAEGRTEQVLGGWDLNLEQKLGAQLDLGFSATHWDDAGLLKEDQLGSLQLGSRYETTLSYQAQPALRLYGSHAYSNKHTSQTEREYTLGFEYSLTGERQRWSDNVYEAQELRALYSPVEGRPEVVAGVVPQVVSGASAHSETSGAQSAGEEVRYTFALTKKTSRGGTEEVNPPRSETITLIGTGENAIYRNDNDSVKATFQIKAQYWRLGRDGVLGGVGENADSVQAFPNTLGEIKARVRFTDSNGAALGRSYLVEAGTATLVSPGVYEVTLATAEGDANTRVHTFSVAAKDVRDDSESVQVTIERLAVEHRLENGYRVAVRSYFASLNRVTVAFKRWSANALNSSDLAQAVKISAPRSTHAEPSVEFSKTVRIPLSFTVPAGYKPLTREGAERGFEVSVQVAPASGAGVATPGVDFAVPQATQFIKVGGEAPNYNGELLVTILRDGNFPESAEHFTLLIKDTAQHSVRLKDNLAEIAPTAVRIDLEAQDYETPVFKSIRFKSAKLEEPTSGTTDYVVEVEFEDIETLSNRLEVPLMFYGRGSEASATSGQDYLVSESKVTFVRDVDLLPDTRTLTFQIKADDLAEGSEFLGVRVVSAGQFIIPDNATPIAEAYIEDADLPYFRFSVPNQLEENRQSLKGPRGRQPNIVRLSAYTDATYSTPLKLERALGFNLVFRPNGFNVNDRVRASELAYDYEIPAGGTYVDIPINIHDNESIDGTADTVIIKGAEVYTEHHGAGLLDNTTKGRGLANLRKKLTLIDDDDKRAKLRLVGESGEKIKQKSGLTLAEGGFQRYFLTLNRPIDVSGLPDGAIPANMKAKVRIKIDGLGANHLNDVKVVVKKIAANGASKEVLPLEKTTTGSTLIVHSAIPLVVKDGQLSIHPLTIELLAPPDQFAASSNEITLQATFRDINKALYRPSGVSRILRRINYAGSDTTPTDQGSVTEQSIIDDLNRGISLGDGGLGGLGGF